MLQRKLQFYHKGIEKQKTPDLSIDLKKMPDKDMAMWSDYEKEKARIWAKTANAAFEIYLNEILGGVASEETSDLVLQKSLGDKKQ